MDWGLAKVLARGGVVDDAKAGKEKPPETLIATARSGSDTDLSHAGSVMGTPSYMAPEQARGETERDRRAGRRLRAGLDPLRDPHRFAGLHGPYLGRDPPQGGPGRHGRCPHPARRLRGRGRADRPGQGLPGGRARGPAARRQRRGRTDHGLPGGRAGAGAGGRARAGRGRGAGDRGAAAAQGAARAGGLGAGVHDAGRAEHDVLPPAAGRTGPAAAEQAAATDRVVGQAVTLRDQAKAQPRGHRALAGRRWPPSSRPKSPRRSEAPQPACWPCDARSRPGSTRPGATRPCSIAWSTSARPRPTTRTARPPMPPMPTPSARPGSTWPACRRPRRGRRSRPVRRRWRWRWPAALDDWAAIRRGKRRDAAGAARLGAGRPRRRPRPLAQRACATALDQADKAARLAGLQALARTAKFDELGPISLHLLGTGLNDAGDSPGGRVGAAEGPATPSAGRLGQLRSGDGAGEAARAATRPSASTPPRDRSAPRRPTSWPMPWQKRGDSDEAIAVFRDLKGLRPGNARHLGCLGDALKAKGLSQRGRARCSKPPWPRAARRSGSSPTPRTLAPQPRQRPDEPGQARRGHRRIPRGDPAQARRRRGPHATSATPCRTRASSTRPSPNTATAIRLKPDDATAHTQPRHRPETARASSTRPSPNIREAIRLKPDDASAHNNLGVALTRPGEARRGRSPNSARRSGSSPTTPQPTPTSATP